MLKIEREKGIYDAETKIPSKIDAYGAGYISKDLETIVGLQTDAPLKRATFCISKPSCPMPKRKINC